MESDSSISMYYCFVTCYRIELRYGICNYAGIYRILICISGITDYFRICTVCGGWICRYDRHGNHPDAWLRDAGMHVWYQI